MSRYPIEDAFVGVIDTQLRNGIGHHSAHYDPDSDLVALYDARRSKGIFRTIPYTRFCDTLLKIFAAFELAAMYHHTLHIDLDGWF